MSSAGPTKPTRESYAYVCQGCWGLVELEPGGRAYRLEDGRHTHLDPECQLEALALGPAEIDIDEAGGNSILI